MLQRPRGSYWGGSWTESRCFEPVWQHWDFLWRPGPLSASTLEWWQGGSQMLSCGLSRRETNLFNRNSFKRNHSQRLKDRYSPVWFAPRQVVWQTILNERWPPHDRQHLTTGTDLNREIQIRKMYSASKQIMLSRGLKASASSIFSVLHSDMMFTLDCCRPFCFLTNLQLVNNKILRCCVNVFVITATCQWTEEEEEWCANILYNFISF